MLSFFKAIVLIFGVILCVKLTYSVVKNRRGKDDIFACVLAYLATLFFAVSQIGRLILPNVSDVFAAQRQIVFILSLVQDTIHVLVLVFCAWKCVAALKQSKKEKQKQ